MACQRNPPSGGRESTGSGGRLGPGRQTLTEVLVLLLADPGQANKLCLKVITR